MDATDKRPCASHKHKELRQRNRGLGEGPPLVPHSVEYDDLFTPHTRFRQRYVSDHRL